MTKAGADFETEKPPLPLSELIMSAEQQTHAMLDEKLLQKMVSQDQFPLEGFYPDIPTTAEVRDRNTVNY